MLFYGSAMNGMINSISQFLVYANLVEAGLGNAAAVMLYKPLSIKDDNATKGLFHEIKHRYSICAFVYSVIAISIAIIYPLTVSGQIEYKFAFFMALIIASSGVVDFLFIGPDKVLLTADQKLYIFNCTHSLTIVIYTGLSILFLYNGASLYVVKLIITLTHLLESLILSIYVMVHYKQLRIGAIKKHIGYKSIRFDQHRAAFVHQISMFVTYNTDLIILTVLLPDNSLLLISVYTVYNLGLSAVTKLSQAITSGINASFGSMIASGDLEHMKQEYSKFEYVYFIVIFFSLMCFYALMIPFVRLYTKGVNDIAYENIAYIILFGVSGLTGVLKDSIGTIINAAGKFKETQHYSIVEALINIVLSLVLIKYYGIIGLLIGTITAHTVMDFLYMRYGIVSLLGDDGRMTIMRLIRNGFVLIPVSFIEMKISDFLMSWHSLILYSIILGITNILILLLVNRLFEKDVSQKIEQSIRLLLNDTIHF